MMNILLPAGAGILLVALIAFLITRIYPKKNQVDSRKQLEYTEDLLKFIHQFILDTFIRSMKDFTDTHDLKMVTKTTMAEFIKTTSDKVYDYLEFSKINLKDSLLDEVYFEEFIAHNCCYIGKRVLEQTIEDTVDEM